MGTYGYRRAITFDAGDDAHGRPVKVGIGLADVRGQTFHKQRVVQEGGPVDGGDRFVAAKDELKQPERQHAALVRRVEQPVLRVAHHFVPQPQH